MLSSSAIIIIIIIIILHNLLPVLWDAVIIQQRARTASYFSAIALLYVIRSTELGLNVDELPKASRGGE